MTLRDLMQVMPEDTGTNVQLCYYDYAGNMHDEMLYLKFTENAEPFQKFSVMVAEYFADDDVIEITNHFNQLLVTVDREVSQDAVKRWKTKVADHIGMLQIMRSWEDEE